MQFSYENPHGCVEVGARISSFGCRCRNTRRRWLPSTENQYFELDPPDAQPRALADRRGLGRAAALSVLREKRMTSNLIW